MSVNHAEIPVNPSVVKLGFWSAVTSALTFVVYTICFTAVLVSSPLYT